VSYRASDRAALENAEHDAAQQLAGAALALADAGMMRLEAAKTRGSASGLWEDAIQAWRHSLSGAGTPEEYSDITSEIAAMEAQALSQEIAARMMRLEAVAETEAAMAQAKASAQPKSISGRRP
jgi:hypothetical protein